MIHDPQWNLVEDIFLIPNAHAQERTIFSEIPETVDSKDLIVAGWQSLLSKAAAARMEFLIEVARHLNLRQHTKAVCGPEKLPPKKTPFENGTHVAVQKTLDERN